MSSCVLFNNSRHPLRFPRLKVVVLRVLVQGFLHSSLPSHRFSSYTSTPFHILFCTCSMYLAWPPCYFISPVVVYSIFSYVNPFAALRNISLMRPRSWCDSQILQVRSFVLYRLDNFSEIFLFQNLSLKSMLTFIGCLVSLLTFLLYI